MNPDTVMEGIFARNYDKEEDFVRDIFRRSVAPEIDMSSLSSAMARFTEAWSDWNPKAKPFATQPTPRVMKNNAVELLQKFKESRSQSKFEPFIRFYRSLIPEENMDPIPTGPHDMLSTSFKTPFRGHGAAALLEHLIEAERKFTANEPRPYYARFFSFIQASGTGKTRTIVELTKKGVIVVYICLRDMTDNQNFPLRDDVPADILLRGLPYDGTAYLMKCYLFLAALFQVLEDKLASKKHLGVEGMATWFDNEFGVHAIEHRRDFFVRVGEKYSIMETKLSPALGSSNSEARRKCVSESRTTMRRAYEDCADGLFGSQASGKPKLIIAIDEAQAMSKKQGDYKPSHILCHALSDLVEEGEEAIRHHPIWTIFASTQSRLSQFAAESSFHDSQRVAAQGQLIATPFTLTGFDQLATSSPQFDLIAVASLAQLRTFGRPLWASFPDDKMGQILPLARQKLIHDVKLKDHDHQALAILSQRFALDVAFGHPECVEFIDTSIASYMRICLSVTDDRAWRYSTYPSEPILSSAAASILHEEPEHVVRCLKCLNRTLRSGMIDKGGRGELLCRVLLLLGRDYTEMAIASRNVPTVPYCRPVRLLDYLRTLFQFDRGLDKQVCDAFADAYVNFSHWVNLETAV